MNKNKELTQIITETLVSYSSNNDPLFDRTLKSYFTQIDPRTGKNKGAGKGPNNKLYARWQISKERKQGMSFEDYIYTKIDSKELIEKSKEIDSGKRRTEYTLRQYISNSDLLFDMSLKTYFDNIDPKTGENKGDCKGPNYIICSRWKDKIKKQGMSFENWVYSFIDDQELIRKAKQINSGKRRIELTLRLYVSNENPALDIALKTYFNNIDPRTGENKKTNNGPNNKIYNKWQYSEEKKQGVSFEGYIYSKIDDQELIAQVKAKDEKFKQNNGIKEIANEMLTKYTSQNA